MTKEQFHAMAELAGFTEEDQANLCHVSQELERVSLLFRAQHESENRRMSLRERYSSREALYMVKNLQEQLTASVLNRIQEHVKLPPRYWENLEESRKEIQEAEATR